METTVFSVEDVRKIVNHVGLDRLMDNAIEGLANACRVYDPGTSAIPARDGFSYTTPDMGLIEWMPAMETGAEVMLKVVGYHPGNPGLRNLPTILSTIVSIDPRNGHLLAVMDGTFLTAVRTGAASAVASQILASPESRTLGLIGCGAQSVTQLHALSRVFELEKVLIYDTDTAVSGSFRSRVGHLDLAGVEIVVNSLEQVVGSSDLLCTATSVEIGKGPVFHESLLKPAVHINAVGSDFPGKLEIPHSVLERSLVCPDFIPQAAVEGECQQLRQDQIGPDLVELVKSEKAFTSYRNNSTVFDSTGWAFEDLIVTRILTDYGRQLGCGTEVALASVSLDPHNPYAFVDPNSGARDGKPLDQAVIYATKEP